MVTHKMRFCLGLVAAIVLVATFGYVSRYPDLGRKAAMAEHHTVGDTISMWPVLHARPDDPMWKQIAFTSVNWANDNKKGMAFGVVLAALLSTCLGYWQLNPRGRMRSAFYGMMLGTPLGVCVNCAAPVFKGALRSRRIEMALALMFASPTLNLVVLMMAFSLLPLYMAVTKLLFNLAVILIGVPLLARWLDTAPVTDLQKLDSRLASERCELPTRESVPAAVGGLVIDFAKQLRWIVVRTVPLMVLAGVLGAVISHLVPLDALHGQSSLIAVLIAATIGLVLPVPMAFDVVLTNALFSAGLPPSVAMALLLSLGVFSIYSFMITWQSASRRWAIYIAAGLWLVIVPLGYLAPKLHQWFYLDRNLASYRALTASASEPPAPAKPAVAAAATGPSAALPSESITIGGVAMTRVPFFAKAAATGKFVQHEGPELGLSHGFMYKMRDYPDPFWIGRGTTAGDFDKDGWEDVAFGSDQGPILYRNLGGKFAEVPLVLPELAGARVYGVAFVDLDGDSWPDLFITTFHRGNYWVHNDAGHFADHAIVIPNGDGILTVSPAFADLDGDGRIDIFNGNMALGVITGSRSYGAGRANGITWNRPGGFAFEPLRDEADGETMASLISDINGDGVLDLYESKDFVVPDDLYFGHASPAGPQLTRLKAPGVLGFATPMFSMSADTGDLDNDLRMDLLITGTLATKQDLGDQPIDGVAATEYKKAKAEVAYCDRIADAAYRANCKLNRHVDHLIPFERLKNLNVRDCQKIDDAEQRDACLLSMMWMIVTNNDDDSDCQQRYGFDPKVLEVCQLVRAAGPYHGRDDYKDEAPQVDKAVLYFGQADGGLGRARPDVFDHPGGWTWSSRIADLDNDGWQDIFNAEGAVAMQDFGWNVYLHNDAAATGKRRFVQRQFSAGLTNDFNLFSFVLIDYDHDGDLDIIGNGSEGPPQIYENQSTGANHSIAFALDSPHGNTANLNARIIIYPASGPAQIRELKAGGGYQTVDAPVAWFGLGAETRLTKLELQWPGGRKQVIEGELTADALYRISIP